MRCSIRHISSAENSSLGGELGPQRVVPAPDQLDDVDRLELVRADRLAGLQVEQLGEDVLAADGQVVVAHAGRDSARLSSPVSASTRYAANSPALRRNSTLDSDTSPQ